MGRAAGPPVARRAEALAEATAGGTLVAIAGTHGKSTTTVMTTEALKGAGVDATGVVGARVAAWRGNLSPGGDEVFVVEADEYDRSFLALSPDVAVVTNIETDHLDIYRDLTDIRGAFAQFVRGARWIVLCADDPYANLVPTPPSAEVVRYGIGSPDARRPARPVPPRGFRPALARADQLFLADIYAAREAPIVGVTSQLIADAMRPTGRLPAWQGARGDLALALAPVVKDGDVVVTMGAGDITRTGPELLALLGPGAGPARRAPPAAAGA